MRWVTFVLGGRRGNVFFEYLKDAFEVYWKKFDRAVDYLFFDYIIDIGYRNIPAIRELIDNIPIVDYSDEEIMCENRRFATRINELLHAQTPSSEWQEILQSELSQTSPEFVFFNYEAMCSITENDL
jgi:hypothetical protein